MFTTSDVCLAAGLVSLLPFATALPQSGPATTGVAGRAATIRGSVRRDQHKSIVDRVDLHDHTFIQSELDRLVAKYNPSARRNVKRGGSGTQPLADLSGSTRPLLTHGLH